MAQIARRRVLIVDDSKFVRATFNSILRGAFDIREEADGEAAWAALESDPAIVMMFTDLNMPKLDGFGLLQRVRSGKIERIKRMPVVIISGEEDEATKKRAREIGANDFIAKSAEAPEVLARIDNLLKLVHATREAETSRQAVEQTATHDPLTGTFTLHFLLTAGRKVFAHAKRHNTPLSLMTFRIDNHAETAKDVGKEVAEQLLARIAKMVQGTLRAEDSMGRTGDAAFTVLQAATAGQQALAAARRLQEQLDKAQIGYGGRTLRIRASIGLAALEVDAADSFEDLMKVAAGRLEKAAGRSQRIQEAPAPAPARPGVLPAEVERALQVLERLRAEQLGEASREVLARLMPFLQGAFKRLHIDLPVEKISQMLRGKGK